MWEGEEEIRSMLQGVWFLISYQLAMVNDHLTDWNIGILEDWNDEFKQIKKKVLLIPHYSIIPMFHHSII
jgi:hypothetical protein